MQVQETRYTPGRMKSTELLITREGLKSLMNNVTDDGRDINIGISKGMMRDQWLIHQPSNADYCRLPQAKIHYADRIGDLQQMRRLLCASASPKNAFTLLVGRGQARGIIRAIESKDKVVLEVPMIRVVGCGLPQIDLTHSTSTNSADNSANNERWSRTISALGSDHWRRLINLNCLIVGCGRTGSQLAVALSRMGVRSITLVDSDVVEAHNIGEMACVSDADVGQPKVQAIQAHLKSFAFPGGVDDPVIHTVPSGIMSLQSLIALKQSDFVFCCVDNQYARLATTFLAGAYLKPLIDIGTRISPANSGSPVRPGLDIRLTIPGEACLACLGGLPQIDVSHFLSMNETANPQMGASRPLQDRASLASLNGIAMSLGVRLFEDFVCGKVPMSRWLQLDFASDGIPTIRSEQGLGAIGCPVCRLTGYGDAAPQQFQPTLEEVSYWQFRLRTV